MGRRVGRVSLQCRPLGEAQVGIVVVIVDQSRSEKEYPNFNVACGTWHKSDDGGGLQFVLSPASCPSPSTKQQRLLNHRLSFVP